MRVTAIAVCCLSCVSYAGYADGPSDRKPTDPRSVISVSGVSAPLPVEAILGTTSVGIMGRASVGGITVSNDGRTIAYDSTASGCLNLWIMSADGTGARQLAASDDRQIDPEFSPDGGFVVYSQDRAGDEYYDVYAVPVNGGEPRRLTNTPDVSEIVRQFSGDGKLLAISVKQKTAPWADLAVMERPGGSIRQLTHEANPNASWLPNAWSPDGRFLYATRSIGIDDSEIYRVDVATGASEQLVEHTGKQLISISRISRDGRTLLVTSNANGGYNNAALLDLSTKKLRWITHTEWSARGVTFTPDDKSVVVVVNADGRASTRFINLKTLEQSERGVPPGWNNPVGFPRYFLPDGSMLLTHEDSSQPRELYRMAPNNSLTQITHNANLAPGIDLPKSQLVSYRSFDGRLISAFVWVPLNLKRDGKAAAVVLPHGGPTSQTSDVFNGPAQLLASRGFVVIAPNVRGSTGFGMEFQSANIKDLGGGDLKDEIAGVGFLESTGFIDAKRVGIWGGSYGGYMALMAIGKTPGVWSAAVDEYGILNWLTEVEHSDPFMKQYNENLLGDPVKDRAIYEASSPLKYIRNETAPLLVLQGRNDIHVPPEEAEQVGAILKAEGRTVEVVYYPGEGHGFVRREDQRDELTRSIAWLQKYLQGAREPAAH